MDIKKDNLNTIEGELIIGKSNIAFYRGSTNLCFFRFAKLLLTKNKLFIFKNFFFLIPIGKIVIPLTDIKKVEVKGLKTYLLDWNSPFRNNLLIHYSKNGKDKKVYLRPWSSKPDYWKNIIESAKNK